MEQKTPTTEVRPLIMDGDIVQIVDAHATTGGRHVGIVMRVSYEPLLGHDKQGFSINTPPQAVIGFYNSGLYGELIFQIRRGAWRTVNGGRFGVHSILIRYTL